MASAVLRAPWRSYVIWSGGAPEFGPNWVRCRLVKLEQPAEDGATSQPGQTCGDQYGGKRKPRRPGPARVTRRTAGKPGWIGRWLSGLTD